MPDAPPPAKAANHGPSFSRIPILLFVRGLAFFTVFIGLIVGLHLYLEVRLIGDSGVDGPLRTGLVAALWSCFACIILGFIGQRAFPRPLARVFQWVGFLWMGAFAVLVVLVPTMELVTLALRAAQATPENWPQVRAVIIAAVAGPVLVWGFYSARRLAQVSKVSIAIPQLHRDLNGLRIAQISDIHIGETLNGAYLSRLVEKVNALGADIIAVTGDLVDGSVARLRDDVAPLAGLRAPMGVYFVTGNHEYYHGGEAWSAHVAELGLDVLHNTHRVLKRGEGRLTLGGVPDLEGRNFDEAHVPDATRAFAGAPGDVPRILLAHQPRFARAAASAGVALQLSGHTHGGQIFPFNFFVKLQQPVVSGLKKLWGVDVYTHRGTGYWGPPFRIGPQSEIAEITLTVVS